MSLPSYGKVWNLGHPSLAELFSGPVLIEEKIDGSQFSFGVIDGELRARSSGAEIHIDNPDHMFGPAVETAIELAPLLSPGLVHRCEYLRTPKHNTLAYTRVPEKHLILFDVHNSAGWYSESPAEKAGIAARLGIECVPALFSGDHSGNFDEIKPLLERESVLGGQTIEGVVVKNYARFQADGKLMMGKFVSEKFKETNRTDWRERNPTKADVVTRLIGAYAAEGRWRKAIQRLRDAGEIEGTPRDIGKLMRAIQADVEEECAAEIREELWAHFWPQVRRGLGHGFPEFYKEFLARGEYTS